MSEVNNTPEEELVEDITVEVEEAQEIPSPVDPTLSHMGEAADAYATGLAIAAMIARLVLNGKTAVANAITLYAGDILMSSAEGAQTIAAAIEAVSDKNAADIIYDTETLQTVKEALDEINTDLTETEIDEIMETVFGGGD